MQNITFGDEGKSDAGEMTTHGQISEFRGVPEEWTSYVERLECYFLANDVADAGKQRAILLSCCGASTYSLIRSLAAPSKPTAVAYKDLVDKVLVILW